MLVVSVHSAVLRTERINIDKALRNVLPARDPFYCCLSSPMLTFWRRPQASDHDRIKMGKESWKPSALIHSGILSLKSWPSHLAPTWTHWKKTRSISGHLKERTEKTCSISRHLKGLPCIELSLFLSALTFALSVGIRDNKVINIPLNNGGQLMVYS